MAFWRSFTLENQPGSCDSTSSAAFLTKSSARDGRRRTNNVGPGKVKPVNSAKAFEADFCTSKRFFQRAGKTLDRHAGTTGLGGISYLRDCKILDKKEKLCLNPRYCFNA